MNNKESININVNKDIKPNDNDNNVKISESDYLSKVEKLKRKINYKKYKKDLIKELNEEMRSTLDSIK